MRVARELLETLGVHGLSPKEAEDNLGLNIPLRDITAGYFPDGSYPPSEKMYDILNLCCQMLQYTAKTSAVPIAYHPVSFWSPVDTFLPLIKSSAASPDSTTMHVGILDKIDHQLFAPKSREYNVFTRMTAGPTINLTMNSDVVDFQQRLVSELKRASSRQVDSLYTERGIEAVEVDPKNYGLPKEVSVFKLLNENHKLTVKTSDSDTDKAVENEPLLIIERKQSALHSPSLHIRLAAELGENFQTAQDRPIKDFFRIVLRSSSDPDGQSFFNWSASNAQLRIEDEPYFYIKAINIKALTEPMDISHFQIQTMVESARNHFTHYLHSSSFSVDYEEFARPIYYYHLVKTAVRMIKLAVTAELINQKRDPVVFNEIMTFFRKEFEKLYDQRVPTNAWTLEKLLWLGFDVWEDFNQLSHQLMSSLQSDHGLFWLYFSAFGLDKAFPSFREMTDEQERQFKQKRINYNLGKDFKYWTTMFDLLPNQSGYRDHRPGKELDQPDDYYMGMCFDVAAYAKALYADREDPTKPPYSAFSCVIVKDGQIVAVAHNEPTSSPEHWKHAEDLAIKRARIVTNDHYLSGCKLYSSVEPCFKCAPEIVECNLDVVGWSVPSNLNARNLFSVRVREQGKPYGGNPELRPNILGKKGLQIYSDWGFTDKPNGLIIADSVYKLQ